MEMCPLGQGSDDMIHTGKCPSCGQVMHYAKMQGLDAKVLMGGAWKAVSYQCPHCETVLSVEIDPIAVKTDIVNEVVKRLGKK